MILETIVKDKNEHIPWVEKYRPQNMDGLISHTSIINTIKAFVKADSLPHLLFYGPPGTGKTSTMVATAKDMYGKKYKMSVLELNASDERGIGVVRNVIKVFCETRSPFDTKDSKKIVILDEADSMTKDAQNALRRIIEKYSRSIRFCLICNYVSKIIPALVSRCTRFKFKRIPLEDCVGRAREICEAENIKINEEAMIDMINLCEGDMRKVVNMIQSVHISLSANLNMSVQPVVDRDFIYKMSGYPHPADIDEIFQILLNDTCKGAFNKIKQLKAAKGISLVSIIKEVSQKLLALDAPGNMAGNVIMRLAEVEYRLSISCSEEIQLGSIVAAFNEARIKS